MKCNMDCFNCPHPDCIIDQAAYTDLRTSRELDKIANDNPTPEQLANREYQRRWREKNREKKRRYMKKRYQENKEAEKQRIKKWEEKNKEYRNAYMRDYYRRKKAEVS